MKSQSLHNSTKKGFMIFFTVMLRPFMKYHSDPLPLPPLPQPPLFSVTQHHEKCWDPHTLYAWCNYWTAPGSYNYVNQKLQTPCFDIKKRTCRSEVFYEISFLKNFPKFPFAAVSFSKKLHVWGLFSYYNRNTGTGFF